MKKEFKPIAMKCTEEQFNAIKPILEKNNLKTVSIVPFKQVPYLVNDYLGQKDTISNVAGCSGKKREKFEEWNQDIFLEYCGIEVKPEFRPIAMKCNQKQFDTIKPILEENGLIVGLIEKFTSKNYLINNLGIECGCVSNISTNFKGDWNRTVFEEWNQDTFLKYCGIKQEKQTEKTMGYKLTVPITDVLKIHKIACSRWKIMIAEFLSKVDSNQEITFKESDIDAMFAAATEDQKPILTEIFGEKKKPIDYDRLKTGSKVMIRYTGQYCGRIHDINNINKDKPVHIVFYRTPHYINSNRDFCTQGFYKNYITFHQNGNYVVFTSHKSIDYITEVIEY